MSESEDLGEMYTVLNAAQEAVAVGDYLAAAALAQQVVAGAGADVNLLHPAGIVLRIAGRSDRAMEVFALAQQAYPDFHFTEIEVGYTHAEAGRDVDALAWFRKATHSAPNYPLGFLRVAQTERRLGDHLAGLATLTAACAAHPEDRELAIEHARTLAFLDRPEEALVIFERLTASTTLADADRTIMAGLQTRLGRYADILAAGDPPVSNLDAAYHLAVQSGHARLAGLLHRAQLVAVAAVREKSGRWEITELLALKLRSAIVDRQPLSFIRLGDGEARFLAFGDPSVRACLTEREASALGDVCWRNWFDQPIAAVPQAVELPPVAD